MKHILNLAAVLLILVASGCNKKEKSEYGSELGKLDATADPIHVEGEIAVFGDFPLEFVSNGKLQARQQAELYFEKNQLIKDIYVKNGDWVESGRLLAELNNEQDLINMRQAEIRLESAKIERQNRVLGHTMNSGKVMNDTVPAMRTISLASGYEEAELNIEKARIDYSNTLLKAPFSGRVVDLNQKPNNFPKAGEPFCRLLNDREFEVVFPILESEIGRLNVGQAISMRPFVEDSVFYKGRITEINPVVDEHGLVKVTALVPNREGRLMQGMNVKVFIKDQVPGCVIVPKEAVVLRNNQQVIFKYVQGKAMWNYIYTVHENSTSYSVIQARAGQEILPGDTVITIGNLNLAHEAEVNFRMVGN